MRFLATAITVLSALILAACAAPPQRMGETKPGRAEGVFVGKTPAQVSDRLAALCLSHPKGNLAKKTESVIECSGKVEGDAAGDIQKQAGYSASPAPEAIMLFTLSRENENTHVYADAFVDATASNGQRHRMRVQSNNSYSTMLRVLWKAGAQQPYGEKTAIAAK